VSDPIRLAGASRETAGLSDGELRRYARHLLLPEVGLEGQKKLKAARVLAVGAGGLGSPLALYLAAAGVGTLGVVDFDFVDESNLQRQILFGVADVGRAKPEAAAERLRGLNPELTVIPVRERLTSSNALDLLRAFDIVADGTDNFPTRYLVNDACVLSGKPNVYASIYRFEGQASVFAVPGGPCYRCLHPEPPPPGLVPSCAEAGVLGVLPGLLGVIQAAEVVKLILGKGETLAGRLLLVDVLGMRFREIRLKRNPDCAVCGDRPTVTALVDYEAFCGSPSSGKTPDIVSGMFGRVPQITVEELKEMRDRGEAPALLDVREPHEYALADLPDAIKVPLGTLPKSLEQVPRDRDLVVYCRSGARSGNAVQFLRQMGYEKAVNLAGGINAWSERIDPSMRKY
jgi:adenylyltransferase/sulfurtransferase